MKNTLSKYEKLINTEYTKYKVAKEGLKQNLIRLEKVRQQLSAWQEVQEFVQTSSAALQNKIHQNVSQVVTRCLKAVFGESAYEFEIRFEKRRGKTEAVLTFVKNGDAFEPLDSVGGGVVDIASFALRVACIACSLPKLRKLVVLDEPFRHLQVSLRPVAASLLEELAKEMDFQFIIISHFQDFQSEAGKVIKL